MTSHCDDNYKKVKFEENNGSRLRNEQRKRARRRSQLERLLTVKKLSCIIQDVINNSEDDVHSSVSSHERDRSTDYGVWKNLYSKKKLGEKMQHNNFVSKKVSLKPSQTLNSTTKRQQHDRAQHSNQKNFERPVDEGGTKTKVQNMVDMLNQNIPVSAFSGAMKPKITVNRVRSPNGFLPKVEGNEIICSNDQEDVSSYSRYTTPRRKRTTNKNSCEEKSMQPVKDTLNGRKSCMKTASRDSSCVTVCSDEDVARSRNETRTKSRKVDTVLYSVHNSDSKLILTDDHHSAGKSSNDLTSFKSFLTNVNFKSKTPHVFKGVDHGSSLTAFQRNNAKRRCPRPRSRRRSIQQLSVLLLVVVLALMLVYDKNLPRFDSLTFDGMSNALHSFLAVVLEKKQLSTADSGVTCKDNSKVKSHFLKTLCSLEQTHANQDKRLWDVIRNSHSDHESNLAQPGPGILLLASNETSHRTTECLATKIALAYSTEVSQVEYFYIDCMSYKSTHPSVAFTQLRQLIKSRVAGGSRSVVFINLESLPAHASTLFFDIFTTVNQAIKKSLFIFTVKVQTGEWNPNVKKLDCIPAAMWARVVRQYLSYSLHSRDPLSMDAKTVEKLVKRLTKHVGWVQKETNFCCGELDGVCKLKPPPPNEVASSAAVWMDGWWH